jgi:hypothetical protein
MARTLLPDVGLLDVFAHQHAQPVGMERSAFHAHEYRPIIRLDH